MATTGILGSFGKKLTLHVVQGAPLTLPMTFLNPPDDDHVDKWPVDLTGSSFNGQIKRQACDRDAVGDIVFTVVDAENGLITFEIPETMFVEQTIGDTPQDHESQFVFDTVWVQSDGKLRPVAYGTIQVRRDV